MRCSSAIPAGTSTGSDAPARPPRRRHRARLVRHLAVAAADVAGLLAHELAEGRACYRL